MEGETNLATAVALLAQEVRGLRQEVHSWRDEQRRMNDDHEQRIRKLEQGQADTRADLGKLNERLGVWQVVQGSFTAIASTIAGLFGRQGP